MTGSTRSYRLSRRFLPLFVAQALGAFNDNAYKNALVILITYRLADSPRSAGILIALAAALFILPFLIVSAPAGEWTDRVDKARVARIVKLAEIPIMMIAGLALWLQSIPLLLLVLLTTGTQSAIFGPVKYAILPQHLETSELLGANGLIEMATFLAILAGTLFGGLMILQPAGTVWVATVMIGLAAIGYLAACRIPAAPPESRPEITRASVVSALPRVMSAVFSNRSLLLPVIAISWFWFMGAVFLTAVPVFTRETLAGDEQVANLVIAAFSLGVGAGSVATNHLLKGTISLALVPRAGLLMSLAIVSLWIAVSQYDRPGAGLVDPVGWLIMPSAAPILTSLVMLAAAAGLFVVPLYAHVQHLSPPASRAAVIAGTNTLNALFMVGSASVVFAGAAAGLAPEDIYGICGIANLAFALFLWRQFRPVEQ